MTSTAAAPPLPHWETIPEDIPGAIRTIKAAIRARIAASGSDITEVFARVEDRVRKEVEDVVAARERGEEVWPVIAYHDIAAGAVPAEQVETVRTRGCAVIRGLFPRERAEQWDRSIVDYVEGNGFFDTYSGPADDFFGSLDMSRPEIYPVYWSRAQMQARQDPRMATAQSFLNHRWTFESEGRTWFDPDRDSLYPDRIRRRPPGADSSGLGSHLDPGCLDLWMTEGYQRHFRHLFAGDVDAYDPWDAAYRTDAAQYPGSTMCSAFRTFQGWTALSEMRHDQGVLHTVPVPSAMAYLMLRPLLPDVPEDSMCGVAINQVFPVGERWHPLLVKALSPIPDVAPGDSVWWHCDMIHSVAPVTDQQGWGNVMYIPAAPWCPRNASYAPSVRRALESGASPSDFPAEDYEASWPDRFGVDDLTNIGRRGLGMTD